jgi:hypothetical protein
MIDSVPEVPIESDQSPDAEQDVALAEDQEIVNESLTPIELVLKERETVGAGVGIVVPPPLLPELLSELPPPPPPPHDAKIKIEIKIKRFFTYLLYICKKKRAIKPSFIFVLVFTKN